MALPHLQIVIMTYTVHPALYHQLPMSMHRGFALMILHILHPNHQYHTGFYFRKNYIQKSYISVNPSTSDLYIIQFFRMQYQNQPYLALPDHDFLIQYCESARR